MLHKLQYDSDTVPGGHSYLIIESYKDFYSFKIICVILLV